MPRGNIHARLERLRERVGQPESPGNGEARARVMRALETIHRLILEHADEIDRDYKERIGRGEEHLDALIAAKRTVWERTAEGRAALDMLAAVQDRGGG